MGQGLYYEIMDAAGIKESDFEFTGFEDIFNTELQKYYNLIKCVESIKLETSPNENLSNGDKVTVNISYDNDLVKDFKIKFKGKKVTKEVEGLEDVKEIDPFEGLEVTFSGIAPFGEIYLDYTGSFTNIGAYDFTIDNNYGLRNGDTIKISLDWSDEQSLSYGYIFTTKEKEYTVEGLSEYVDGYDDFNSDFIDMVKKEVEDTIYAHTASSYDSGVSVSNLAYAGYILNTAKLDALDYVNYFNELYVIYSATVSHTENHFNTAKVYFPVKFYDIIKENDTFTYSNTLEIVGNSKFGNSRYRTKGYINPMIAYKDLVESNRDKYSSEVGDGFEVFAESKTITKLSDISTDFRNTLAMEAKDIIESYVAEDYASESHLEGLSLMGEYLLVAKNQGDDYEKNNKYIVVYSATASHDDGRFETTQVYFPVEYDGIVALPNDDYMVTNTEGILGKSRLGNSFFYYTDGYIDGTQMYSDIITANRDLYTYEVSDGLKVFGE